MSENMNTTESVRCGARLADLQSRLQKCNARKRVLLALPPLKHDMTLPMTDRLDTYERLQSERVAEDISIMAEALDVMKQLDAIVSANAKITRDDERKPAVATQKGNE